MQVRYVAAALLLLPGCQTTKVRKLPNAADLQGIIEQKPKPPKSILTDPEASVRYNESVEAWADRLRAAGERLCEYFVAEGMVVDCHTAEARENGQVPSVPN